MTGRLSPIQVFFRHFLQDAELLEAWLAMSYAGYCGEDFKNTAMAGGAVAAPAAAVSPSDLRCWLASLTCSLLADSLAIDYVKYQEQMQRHAAKLQLLLAAHALVDGQTTLEEILARGIPGHTLVLTDAQHLRLESGPGVREPLVFELDLKGLQASRAP